MTFFGLIQVIGRLGFIVIAIYLAYKVGEILDFFAEEKIKYKEYIDKKSELLKLEQS